MDTKKLALCVTVHKGAKGGQRVNMLERLGIVIAMSVSSLFECCDDFRRTDLMRTDLMEELIPMTKNLTPKQIEICYGSSGVADVASLLASQICAKLSLF